MRYKKLRASGASKTFMSPMATTRRCITLNYGRLIINSTFNVVSLRALQIHLSRWPNKINSKRRVETLVTPTLFWPPRNFNDANRRRCVRKQPFLEFLKFFLTKIFQKSNYSKSMHQSYGQTHQKTCGMTYN